MADLAVERITKSPPFTYCGVNMSEPFLIREKRSNLKKYGAMFTCLVSRTVHVEVTNQINTDSFIQALRRMIARHGNVEVIQYDNGSNFRGAENELKKAFSEMKQEKNGHFMLDNFMLDNLEKKHTYYQSHGRQLGKGRYTLHDPSSHHL